MVELVIVGFAVFILALHRDSTVALLLSLAIIGLGGLL